MIKFISFILALLGFFLPLHGGISVFLPESFRWWKEFCILFLFLSWIFLFVRKIFIQKKLNTNVINILKKNLFGILFLFWGIILVFISENIKDSAIAVRYLGFGIFLYLIVDNLFILYGKSFGHVLQKFCTYFLLGSFISVLFGFWIQFGNGISFVQNFYSKIISSWVPGQNIPIYHETSNGLMRMQGLSSGPVEFGHLMLMALFMSLFYRFGFLRVYFFRYLAISLFLGAVYHSGSRSAILGAGIFLGFYILSYVLKKKSPKSPLSRGLEGKSKKNQVLEKKGITGGNKKNISDVILISSKITLLLLLSLMGLKYLVVKTDFIENLEKHEVIINISDKFLRMGDSDHFTRPMEAFEKGQENIFWGNLGDLGPAKRASNLEKFNDDKALIAENVFVDIFAQMGILGILFYVLFFLVLWFKFLSHKNYKMLLFLSVFLLLMNFATLFDMTPLALSFFLFLCLGRNLKK